MYLPLNALLLPAGIVIGIVVQTLIGSQLRQKRRSNALLQVESRIDALMKKTGVQYDPYAGTPDKIADALRSGKMLDAIRLYRESTGAGLKQAKDYIESLATPESQVVRKLELLLKKSDRP